jgi:hypothetical protein
VTVAALLLGGVFLTQNAARVSLQPNSDYGRLDLDLQDYDLFDIGVTDVNNDGLLDIFTANHSARQKLLLNIGQGQFRDDLSSLGLDQDKHFPQLEDSLEKPEIAEAGLYIYRQARWLNIEANAIDTGNPARGSITIPWPVVVDSSPASTVVSESTNAAGMVTTTVEFELQGNQSVVLNGVEDIVEVPHRVRLETNLGLDQIYVGRELTHPATYEFEMIWRDRHGMAWADYDGDGMTDLFIGRGGIKGQLDSVPAAIADELMSRQGRSFVDRTATAGLQKGNCPARQVSWIDFDSDGDLDLYVSCGRGSEPSYPNQLFRQNDQHEFIDVAGPLGLDYPSASVYAWLDADNDGDMDLLSVEDDVLQLYANLGGDFEKTSGGTELSGSRPYKLSIADFDNDGDLDAFAIHSRKSLLIMNDDGQYSVLMPASVGLPDTGRTANWVDFDNDGLVDLHVVPGGLYRQDTDHRFHQTDLLKHSGRTDRIVDARSTWFDVDNDGYRDAIIFAQLGPTLVQRFQRKFAGKPPNLGEHWRSGIYSATGSKANHWLQIDLEGPAGNRQAIGARAYVSTADSTQLQHVGSAEGSHFGQGHYRLYFGLGSSETADEVRIVWADGTTHRLQGVQADQRLNITYTENE